MYRRNNKPQILSEAEHLKEIRHNLVVYVLRYTKDRSLAEDIVHDVFLKVHERFRQLRDRDKVSGWMFRIAKNAVIDHFRRKTRTIHSSDLNWHSEEASLNDCVSACLLVLISELPDKYREALELADLQNLSQLDLSHRLKLSYSGAKSRVQRARRMLKEMMEKTYRIQFDKYGNAVTCESRLPCECG